MTTIAYVTVIHYATVEIDVDELVAEVGAKARSNAYLKDYALGQPADHIFHSEVEAIHIEKIIEPKIKKGIGSY